MRSKSRKDAGTTFNHSNYQSCRTPPYTNADSATDIASSEEESLVGVEVVGIIGDVVGRNSVVGLLFGDYVGDFKGDNEWPMLGHGSLRFL